MALGAPGADVADPAKSGHGDGCGMENMPVQGTQSRSGRNARPAFLRLTASGGKDGPLRLRSSRHAHHGRIAPCRDVAAKSAKSN